MSNGLSWRCTEDTWFKCSKDWIKRIDVVHHLPPQHYLYLLIKNIIVKITYLKHNTFIQDYCVLESLLRLLGFCEDVAKSFPQLELLKVSTENKRNQVW